MRGSRRYAEGVFRGLTGMSVLEAIRRVRFENAKVLLETTDKPVALVGSSSGYQSETTFCREFKEMTGHTPGVWRIQSGLASDASYSARQRSRAQKDNDAVLQ